MRHLITIIATAIMLVSCGSGAQYLETHTHTPQRTIDSLTTLNGFMLPPYIEWPNRVALVTSDSTIVTIVSSEVRLKHGVYTISVLETDNEGSTVRFRKKINN